MGECLLSPNWSEEPSDPVIHFFFLHPQESSALSQSEAMIVQYVERSFLDPEGIFDEYFQLGSRRKVGPIKNKLASPNTSN